MEVIKKNGTPQPTTIQVEPIGTTETAFVQPQQSFGVSFHDIVYEISSCCGKRNRKTILRSISGQLPQGLNAIMGPTGSGKTRWVIISGA